MLIIANWKAYVVDLARAKSLAALAKRLARTTGHTIVLAPPAPLLGHLGPATEHLLFAAQDVSATTGGAQTGESLAQAFVAAGATYALIGHSERRALGDTGPIVAQKLSHALAQGLTPILCVGEAARDTDGQYLVALREQLVGALAPLSAKERRMVRIAYEPQWAINKNADGAIRAEDLAEVVLYLRKVLADLLPGKTAREAIILYGGSVESGNIAILAEAADLAGFLVGHASVDPQLFEPLVRAAPCYART